MSSLSSPITLFIILTILFFFLLLIYGTYFDNGGKDLHIRKIHTSIDVIKRKWCKIILYYHIIISKKSVDCTYTKNILEKIKNERIGIGKIIKHVIDKKHSEEYIKLLEKQHETYIIVLRKLFSECGVENEVMKLREINMSVCENVFDCWKEKLLPDKLNELDETLFECCMCVQENDEQKALTKMEECCCQIEVFSELFRDYLFERHSVW